MPEIGELQSGSAIGSTETCRFIWAACEDCGKERWVQLRKGQPKYKRCRPCVIGTINFKKGARHGNWKGGTGITPRGYLWVVLDHDDFFFTMAHERSRQVLLHRLIMAKHLGRCLQAWEEVHHKNGIKDDNRIENLELATKAQHTITHSKGYRDGYAKGLSDGKDKRISELEKRVTILEAENALLKFQEVH